MGILDRAAILAVQDFEIKKVSVPEWGGEVGIKTFDGATRAKLIKPAKDGNMPDDWMERVIVSSACDGNGNLIFTDEDIPGLSTKSAVVLERLFSKSIELNGLTADAVEKDKGEPKPTPR